MSSLLRRRGYALTEQDRLQKIHQVACEAQALRILRMSDSRHWWLAGQTIEGDCLVSELIISLAPTED